MIVHKCDQCGKEIGDPDSAPTQDDKIFCSNVCRAQYTIQSEPQLPPEPKAEPADAPQAPTSPAATDEPPEPPKKKKSALALWTPIIIAGLIVTGFHLPEYFAKKKLDTAMDELRASGKLDELLGLDSGHASEGPYTDDALGFSITFPMGWTVKDALSDASIAKKAVYKHADGRRATIIVYAWEADPTLDWGSFTPRSLFAESYGQTGEYLDGGETTMGGHRALWFKFKCTEYPIESYAITFAVLKDNILFSIFGQTLIGDYQWFKENEQIIIDSINSFQFL